MKTRAAASIKKKTVTVKDLKTRKNPKGGANPHAFHAGRVAETRSIIASGGAIVTAQVTFDPSGKKG